MAASEDILIAGSGEKKFALPLEQVSEVFELIQPAAALPGAPSWLGGMVNHHGQVVFLLDAGVLLGQPAGRGRQVIMIEAGGERLGLRVEKVEGVAGAGGPGAENAPIWNAESLQRLLTEKLSGIDGNAGS